MTHTHTPPPETLGRSDNNLVLYGHMTVSPRSPSTTACYAGVIYLPARDSYISYVQCGARTAGFQYYTNQHADQEHLQARSLAFTAEGGSIAAQSRGYHTASDNTTHFFERTTTNILRSVSYVEVMFSMHNTAIAINSPVKYAASPV